MANKVYQIVTDRVIALLERGVVPWRRPWAGADVQPQNLLSRRPYRGVNPFLLACTGFASPYWVTFKQAKTLGGSVRKGEKSTPVIFWKRWRTERIDSETGDRKSVEIPILRYYPVFNAANATVTNCIFRNNITGVSGGIFNDSSSPEVTNCLFTGNTAASFGGGIFNFDNSDPAITNCTFSNNNAFDGAAIHNFASGDSPTIANCIMWGNTVTNGHPSIGGNGTPTVTYSDVEAGFDGTGNIELDPLFVAPGTGDYRHSSGSPCIDAADNTAVPKGIVVDLDGEDRFVDDPDTPDTGNGDPPIVDMGTYEFQLDESLPCPWDLDNSGAVDVKDLLFLLGAWGPCPKKGDCPADFDGCDVVGVKDLLFLLGAWGPCP